VGDLDLVAKILMCAAPEGFVRLWLGHEAEVVEVRAADKELQARKAVMDKLYELRFAREQASRWLHVEVAAVWEHDLPFRMLDYQVMSRRVVEGEIGSLLICLKPGSKQGPATDTYRVSTPGAELTFRYALVRAWDWTTDELLAGSPALIPFVPYAGDASEAGVGKAIAAVDGVSSRALRAELLGALAVFAQNVFKEVDWAARMPQEMLMESTVYKKGEAAGERKMVAFFLAKRLQDGAQPFVARLETLSEEHLEKVAEVLSGDQPRDELIAALERLLPSE